MAKKKTSFYIRSIAIASVIFAVSYYVILNCWQGLSLTYIEDGWKTVPGLILSPDAQIPGKENIERKYKGLELAINYEYEVGGVLYRSNSVSKEAHVTPESFPEGKKVDVYYNPSDPGDSVLVRTRAQTPYLYAIMAFFVLLSGVTLFGLIKDLTR